MCIGMYFIGCFERCLMLGIFFWIPSSTLLPNPSPGLIQFVPFSLSNPFYHNVLPSFLWNLATWFLNYLLTSTPVPNKIHTSEDSKLTSTNNRNLVTFVSLGLSYLSENDCFQLYPFACSSHNVIFLNTWIIFLCVNAQQFGHPLISWCISGNVNKAAMSMA